MISRLFPFSSIILALLFIGGFAFLSRYWRLHFQLHSAALFFGVGIYVGQVLWSLVASYYAPECTLHLFDGLMAVFFGFYGYHRTDKSDVVAASTFLGAIIVAYSINLFTEGKIGINGNDGVQAVCIVVLGYLGHMVQMRA
jgi:small basic protein